MAWKWIVTYTRPNTGVAWHRVSRDKLNHIKTTYEDTGKSVSYKKELSGDGLTLTKTRTFNNESSYNEYRSDSVIISLTDSIKTENDSKSITKVVQSGDL